MAKSIGALVVIVTGLAHVTAGRAHAQPSALDATATSPSPGDRARELVDRLDGPFAETAGDLANQLASGVVNRFRRGVAIGPFVGGVAGGTVSGGKGSVFGISYGIGLYTMRQPSILDLATLVRERLKERVQSRLKDLIASRGSLPPDLGAIVREVAEDVYREVFGELNQRKLLSKPGFGAVLEGVSRIEPGGTQFRFGLSYGIGPVSVGAGTGIQIASGEVSGLAGLELSLRLTPWGNLRTPVIDVHSRFDVGFAGDRSRTLIAGTRFLIDVL